MPSKVLPCAATLLLALAAAQTLAADAVGSGSKPGSAFKDCPDCPEMVVIPPGSFEMGSTAEERAQQGVPENFGNREQPVHRVTIARAFAVSRNEITRGLYARFVQETGRPIEANCIGYDRAKDNWGLRAGTWQDPGFKQGDNEAAACMSWVDGRDYAAWLAKQTGKRYRLVNEAEWEYAARAGTKTARYWGDNPRLVCENANIMSTATFAEIGSPESWQDKLMCAGRDAWTMPVGSFESNPFGLNDVYGSLWEWVADCAHENYVGAPTDGSAWDEPGCERRTVRGGAFHSEFWLARSATRGAGLNPNAHPVASGFRIARDLD
jgi:formylglycine-generating enzyme required for sulfatase activity